MKLRFTAAGWDDYLHWAEADRARRQRLDALIRDARRTPFQGLGKPEALKGNLAGWWSRRVDGEHRLVHRVAGKAGLDQRLGIGACGYHY